MSDPVVSTEIEALRAVVRQLRDPLQGCAWDRAQTLASLAPYTLEEAHEVVEAIDRQSWSELRDELGDLLFQIVLQSQLAAEAGHFDFEAVCRASREKMVRRHPHVFDAERHGRTPPDWEALKALEPGRQEAGKGALAGVPHGLPSWMRTQKLQTKAARVGFDWRTPLEALAKLEEEVAEVRSELEQAGSPERLEDELGDVLFAVISLARHGGVDLGRAMRGANRKFEARFRQMEMDAPGDAGLAGLSRPMLEALWLKAKRQVPQAPAADPAAPEVLP